MVIRNHRAYLAGRATINRTLLALHRQFMCIWFGLECIIIVIIIIYCSFHLYLLNQEASFLLGKEGAGCSVTESDTTLMEKGSFEPFLSWVFCFLLQVDNDFCLIDTRICILLLNIHIHMCIRSKARSFSSLSPPES